MTLMAKEIPWLRVFVEGVVIVGSILLAFGIDAWWARRGESMLERSYLVGMQAEFEAAEAELESLLVTHRDKTAGLEELHRLLRSGEGSAAPDSVVALSRLLWTVDPYAPEMSTYQNLVESRGMSFIQDDSLRVAFRAYEVALGSNRAWDDYLIAFDQDQMVALLASRLPYFAQIFEDGDSGGSLRPSVEELAADMSFRNLIAIRYSGERTLVNRRTRLIETVRDVRRLLETAVDD